MSLTARYLEANGIPTVIMGCAKDIVELAGVPRFLFSDFPLGNAAGKPHDPESQRQTLALALDLLENATHTRTTLQNPQHWDDNGLWKLDFQNVDQIPADEIARRMDWRDKAACLTVDPELFFPVGNTGPAVDQIDRAKSVCSHCPVTEYCLQYALDTNQDSGVWGGLSEDERRALKRRAARARRAS